MNLPVPLNEIIPLVTLVGGLVVAFATAWATYVSVLKRAEMRNEALIKSGLVEFSDEDRKLCTELTAVVEKLVEEVHEHRKEIYDLAGEIRRNTK